MSLDAFVDASATTLSPDSERTSSRGRQAVAGVIDSSGSRGRAAARRSFETGARLVVPVLAAVAAAALLGARPSVGLAVVTAWVLVQVRSNSFRLRAGMPDLGTLLRNIVVPFSVVALLVTVGVFPQQALLKGLLVSAVATLALVLTAVALRTRPTPRRVLLVGDLDGIGRVAAAWATRPEVAVVGASVVGSKGIDHEDLDATVARLRLFDGIDDLADLIGPLDVEGVVVVPSPGLEWEDVRKIGWALEDTQATLALRTELDGVSAHRLALAQLAGSTVAEIAPSRPRAQVRFTKSAIDRVCGLGLLIAASPLLAALAVAIRLDSRGPALFTQTRVGQDGRLFKVYKLRTMCTDAENIKHDLSSADEGNGVLFKIKRDPRITRVGHLLRRTSLDELPQLINVVRGEMSLVGPRPALPQEVDKYDEVARRRLAVRPGMTGLWQVSGRSDLDWDGTVALDVRYTDNVAIAEDLRICWRTIGAVTSGRGAY